VTCFPREKWPHPANRQAGKPGTGMTSHVLLTRTFGKVRPPRCHGLAGAAASTLVAETVFAVRLLNKLLYVTDAGR
jgi:hypothetical protein